MNSQRLIRVTIPIQKMLEDYQKNNNKMKGWYVIDINWDANTKQVKIDFAEEEKT